MVSLLTVFHIVGLFEISFGTFYLMAFIPPLGNLQDAERVARGERVEEIFGGGFRFLTFWNAVIISMF